jgi:hypothetical protein
VVIDADDELVVIDADDELVGVEVVVVDDGVEPPSEVYAR